MHILRASVCVDWDGLTKLVASSWPAMPDHLYWLNNSLPDLKHTVSDTNSAKTQNSVTGHSMLVGQLSRLLVMAARVVFHY